MAKRVSKGINEEIKANAPEIKLEYHRELASLEDLEKLLNKWEKTKDGQILLRSNAAKWLGNHPPSIPTFIGGCNHPGQLGAVENLEAPQGMITGVTYYLPKKPQFEVFMEIVPDMESILLLLEKGHPSSLIDQEGTKKVCNEFGIEYNEKFCSSNKDALKAVKRHQGKVSAIILGTQAILIENTKDIVEVAGETPVLAYSSKPVKSGGLGGFVADDHRLGRMLAQSVIQVLVNDKPINEVPIKFDQDAQFYVNANTAQKLGIDIPFQILETATVIE